MGTAAGVSKDRLFLCRNTGRSRGTPADEDPRLLDTFAQVAINNGLECKVACSNSKVGAEGVGGAPGASKVLCIRRDRGVGVTVATRVTRAIDQAAVLFAISGYH